jgi:hypothetical protein
MLERAADELITADPHAVGTVGRIQGTGMTLQAILQLPRQILQEEQDKKPLEIDQEVFKRK